jgi:hypothetical protein
MIHLFKELNLSIKIVPIILCGTLEQILQLNPKFESVVYKEHGLEKMENNFAEGYVIHPSEEQVIETSSDTCRLIFKFKNPQFSEISHNATLAPSEKTLTFQQQCFELLKEYVVQNRFDNLYTKLNETDDKNKLIDMMFNDVVTDFREDHINSDDLICCEDNIVANTKALIGFIKGFVLKRI